MILKPRPEPETLSEIIEASLIERNLERRSEYERQLGGTERLSYLKLLKSIIMDKINKEEKQNERLSLAAL
jgi:hypothetical protein